MEKIICIILLVLYGVVMLMMCYITLFKKNEKPKNNVHFYVARDKDGSLWLYIGEPIRADNGFVSALNIDLTHRNFHIFGLNKNDYDNLKWSDDGGWSDTNDVELVEKAFIEGVTWADNNICLSSIWNDTSIMASDNKGIIYLTKNGKIGMIKAIKSNN